MEETKKFWFLASNRSDVRILNCTREEAHDRKEFAWSSLSCGHDTKEELIKAEGILDEPCKECGCIVSTNYMEDTKQRLVRDNICFTCLFWISKLDIKDDPRTARINGTHYYINDDKPNGFKGFGGAEFNIRFNDGRLVITHNLWCQGEIPESFRERLPDNAVFVTVQHTERNKVLNKLFPELS